MAEAVSTRELETHYVGAVFDVDFAHAAKLGVPVPAGWSPSYDDPAETFLYDADGNAWKSLAQIAESQPETVDLDRRSLADLDGTEGEVSVSGIFWKDDALGLVPLHRVSVTYRVETPAIAADLGAALAGSLVRRLKEGRLRVFNPEGGPAEYIPAPDKGNEKTFGLG